MGPDVVNSGSGPACLCVPVACKLGVFVRSVCYIDKIVEVREDEV